MKEILIRVVNKIKDRLGIERELSKEEKIQMEKLVLLEIHEFKNAYKETKDIEKSRLIARKKVVEYIESGFN